ncbi:hypothetical protein PFICI_13262 [Pestalotiopsis fici W106-1]|uniref:Uncharacterized protein n=1 Tax=Pestalotiopsis fici (strain W106-1 / CGMCC3.15140) TaxID=1229662 RepID=W3WLP8_PESFW|nr:uncharacterized protein PFICI_13262 [Pestalotiopsis fici W106-1]ETS74778.1 hypothetical protein PFICI_13262 [Pestalotiopsis fici W106-1]
MSSDNSDQAMDVDSSHERALQADTTQSNDTDSGTKSNAPSGPIDSKDLVANQTLDDFEICPCGCRERSSDIMNKFFNVDPQVRLSDTDQNLMEKLRRILQTTDHNVRKREAIETLQARFLLCVGHLCPPKAQWGLRINFSSGVWNHSEKMELLHQIKDLAFDIKQDLLKLNKEYQPLHLPVIFIDQDHPRWYHGTDFNVKKYGVATDDEELAGRFDVNRELKTYLSKDLEDEVAIEFTPLE